MKRYIPRIAKFKPKDRVYVFGEWPAVVLNVGPEQSEVKFSNGNVVVVCNSWVEKWPKTGAS